MSSPDNEEVTNLKFMVIGERAVGKTCMLISYTTNSFPGEYVPTVFDNYLANTVVEGHKVCLGLWDTAGSGEYDTLRPVSYPGTHCFVLCFSLTARDTYESIATKWAPEVREFSPDVPLVLVGTKLDVRLPGEPSCVTTSEGRKMADQIGASKYVECSSLTQEGLAEVFEQSIRAVLEFHEKQAKSDKKKNEKCSLQ